MLSNPRSPLAIVLTPGLASLAGYLAPCDANVAAVEQLVKETNARGAFLTDAQAAKLFERPTRAGVGQRR